MSIEQTIVHEIVVSGTPEQVWKAIATGAGITGWFVPAKVEERVGGAVELDFGPGMGAAMGQVTVWEPPTRFVHQGSGGSAGQLAYEWQVEARGGGTCLVRLVTSGFMTEADWQAEYDSTSEGWKMFLNNLQLYLTHFPGQRCTSMLVQRLTDYTPADAWHALTTSLGLPHVPSVGQQVSVSHGPPLAGRVERFASGLMTLLLDAPARGIVVVGTESFDGKALPMLYMYLFDSGAQEAIARDKPAWCDWMERTFTGPAATPRS